MNKNVTVDNLDINEPVIASHAIQKQRPAPRPTWDVIVARYGMGLVAAGAAWWVSPEWAHTYVVGASCALGTLAAAKHILQDTIGGFRVWTFRNDVRASQVVDGVNAAALAEAARRFPAVSSYSPTIQQAPALPAGAIVEGQIVDAQPTVVALPPAEWLAWFDTRPHGLLAAETGGGKSTTAKAVLGSRIERGEMVFLLDPHSSDWFGLPGIGGGEDWSAVWLGMQVVIAEYRRRLAERDEYLHSQGRELPPSHFPRITVLLDEGNLAYAMLSRASKRGDATPWARFVETLGSGARKVNISILMLAQSPNVEDIGLSGPMRQNFTRLALDASTTRLMTAREETNAQRKKDILAALQGLDYPATSVQQGRVVLLDRTGLDRYPAPHNPTRALWAEGYERVETAQRKRALTMPAQRATVAHSQPSATLRATVAVPVQNEPKETVSQVALRSATGVAPLSNAQRDELVRILRRRKNAQGKPLSQDFIREQLERAGLTIAQSRLIDICREVDRA